MTNAVTPRVGFLGTGLMGEPMAENLLASGVDLLVWNRSAPAPERLAAKGARVADSVEQLFAQCDVVLMMLSTHDVIDAVLERGTAAFTTHLAGTTLVHLGTTSPRYSAGLERDVKSAGGRYVEAPVSGSREPARRRELVGMLAGDDDAVAAVGPIIELLCASTTVCGAVPAALTMKLAVNVFLVTLVTGLAESFAFAQQQGLDLQQLRGILDGGQMSSPISRVKTAKYVDGDLSPQASIADVLKNCELIVDAASQASLPVPLMQVCRSLFAQAVERGDGTLDMVAVTRP
ncbi:NAD(P)-dependent oxidoreductase [Humibacter ginsenosidimutans]|uniref:NAD(P)-dependent oxidoreductase n=1 Tax=Humibacter ginsenosidimutans TaxID=2599293 RepID=A0A5B8M0A5_9MICO|nr:NAD(P)-dependent oxidoreductase [Humibacter ginsenosidimutans]QDZ13439.1 NAD(P)-dependent oxidoreductase [Humibacter ginsenosidimutans]